MILYIHGYGSSAETAKAGLVKGMQSYTIDYDTNTFEDTFKFFESIITNNDVTLIVGHSLGGYWALKIGNKYEIPVVLVNPSLFPTVISGYPPCTNDDTINKSHRFAYLEMGDEVIDMAEVSNFLEGTTSIYKVCGGHHRIQFQNKLKDFINTCLNYTIVG
jgi:hypothetical protein